MLRCPEGYWCGEGTLTLDPSDTTQLKPQPCKPGTFCLGGVAHDLVIPWLPDAPAGVSAAQRCTEGTFCREASPTPRGTDQCYPGHYCPAQSEAPTR